MKMPILAQRFCGFTDSLMASGSMTRSECVDTYLPHVQNTIEEQHTAFGLPFSMHAPIIKCPLLCSTLGSSNRPSKISYLNHVIFLPWLWDLTHDLAYKDLVLYP